MTQDIEHDDPSSESAVRAIRAVFARRGLGSDPSRPRPFHESTPCSPTTRREVAGDSVGDPVGRCSKICRVGPALEAINEVIGRCQGYGLIEYDIEHSL